MSDTTGIQWTDATLNVVTGCTKVSAGCKNCYAERDFHRPYPGRDFGDIRLHEDRLEKPLRWRRPRRIFVNSLSDLFHEEIPDEFIDRVFAVMALAGAWRRWGPVTGHTFQVLTKRPERMHRYLSPGCGRADRIAAEILVVAAAMPGLHATRGRWPDDVAAAIQRRDPFAWPLESVHLGVSVEDQATADERIPLLLQTPAAVRFVSAEPLLGAVDVRPWVRTPRRYERSDRKLACGMCCWKDELCDEPLHVHRDSCRWCRGSGLAHDGLDWIIVGGESGPRARPCDVAWIRSIVEQCRAANVPCFVKQLGASPHEMIAGGNHGGDYFHEPRELRLRDRKGGDPAEWAEDLRVREFPRST